MVWGVVTVGGSRLAGLRAGPFGMYDITGAILGGLIIGSIMAWMETRPIGRTRINAHPWLDITLRTLVYSSAVIVTVLLGRTVLSQFFSGQGVNQEAYFTIEQMFQDKRVIRFIILMILASFIVNFVLHLRLTIGPEHLTALFTGRYRVPVEEERVFVFIDLIDSTAIAQRLGALDFTHFKHDFFSDLTEPLMQTGGTIVQYVGDEVMITWKRDMLSKKHDPLLFLQLSRKQISANGGRYMQRFGTIPAFRTGVHAGTIVVAEVGDSRRDIVYSGDVVNTSARLLQACRPNNVNVLISAVAIQWLGIDTFPNFHEKGELLLRGRAEALKAWTYNEKSPVSLM